MGLHIAAYQNDLSCLRRDCIHAHLKKPFPVTPCARGPTPTAEQKGVTDPRTALDLGNPGILESAGKTCALCQSVCQALLPLGLNI